jgi:serine/threonine protein kinase
MNLCPNCFESELTDDTCPKCGYAKGSEDRDTIFLPYKTLIDDRFITGKVLSWGDFAFTYLGYDSYYGNKVVIKEFFPLRHAGRTAGDPDQTVYIHEKYDSEVYKRAMERFETEGVRLLRLPLLSGFAGVREVIRERGTVYLVQRFVDGVPLSQMMPLIGVPISETRTLEYFLPIIKALGEMHKAGIIHRDIRPDNIMIEMTQRGAGATLIGFGAILDPVERAAYDIESMARISRNFSPEELYDSDLTRQGTWTDVYGICAVMYYALTGEKPPDVIDRLRGEALPEITEQVSESVKKAIYKGLENDQKDRIKTMDELYDELIKGASVK